MAEAEFGVVVGIIDEFFARPSEYRRVQLKKTAVERACGVLRAGFRVVATLDIGDGEGQAGSNIVLDRIVEDCLCDMLGICNCRKEL